MSLTNEDLAHITPLVKFSAEQGYVIYLFRPNLPHTPERLYDDEPNYTTELKVGAKIDDGDGNHCLVIWTYSTQAYEEIASILGKMFEYNWVENEDGCVYGG